MKTNCYLYFCIFLLLFSIKSNAQQKAKDFQYYVFALSWQPAFCESKADKKLPECDCQTEKSFDAKNFTLHGLWPSLESDKKHDYGYCDVPQNTIEMDKNHQWDKMPDDFISKKTKAELDTYMPGSKSYLYKHEWFRHGVCTGLTGDAYFGLMLELEKQFTNSKFNQYIASKIGKSVTKEEVLTQFEKEFGKGTRNNISLSCTNVKGVNLLTEIQIFMVKDLSTTKKIKDQLCKENHKPTDRCPDTFKIDKAGIGNFN